ncbi:MAG: hypothetical protein WCY83_03015 [Bacteroidales bacterium]
MNYLDNPHKFHIPVMGIGYSMDTAVRLAPFGISSVISLVDDRLIEKMREFYARQFNFPFKPISIREKDHRAQRITSYLNLIDRIVKDKFEELKRSVLDKKSECQRYIEMLPDFSDIRKEFKLLMESRPKVAEIRKWIQNRLRLGSIDVNIMTKLDKANYLQGEVLPQEYNDAHAALRGFAQSDLESSIVLSAGLNPRLYAYFEQFDDFYPDTNGYIKKRITLKVSDYRSAIIQGKYLAKKGLWVSEYRVESGLNCGGHAFATDGFLLGPILEAFKNSRKELVNELYPLWVSALQAKGRPVSTTIPNIRVTAQGGVGTAEEQDFLTNYFELDSVGWGTPFLLVPEAVTMDETTRQQLCEADEEQVYLSGISPLGVPFYSMKNNTKDQEKQKRIDSGKPGSTCPKRYACLDTEFTGKPICTASREYQEKKINQLDQLGLSEEEYRVRYDSIVEKSCICVGLGTALLLANELEYKVEGPGVSVCPGPNLAYFSRTYSLEEMIGHIYGRTNVMERTDRPHFFLKELDIYIDYLKNHLVPKTKLDNPKEKKSLDAFRDNLLDGIRYYKELFSGTMTQLQGRVDEILRQLNQKQKEIV